MIAGDELERVDQEICDRYPYPLVATYDRAQFQAPDPVEAHEYLLDLFEVTLKYCATIALAQYFHDHTGDARINAELAEIQRPSLGHWNGWLRDILGLYRRSGRAMAIPELDSFYRMRHQGAVLAATQSLSSAMAAMGYRAGAGDATSVTTQQFFDLLIGYRNRLAHGARPSPHDRAIAAGLLAPALRELYLHMSALAEYRLVYVRSVTLEFDPQGAHRYRHVVTHLTGQSPRAAPNPVLLADAYPDKQLYLLDRASEFRPLLSVHPFLIFAHCGSCNREQTFLLNMSDANSQDYIGYQCTHHFSPTEYLDYMQRLLTELGVPLATAPLQVSESAQRNGGSASLDVEAAPLPPPPPPPEPVLAPEPRSARSPAPPPAPSPGAASRRTRWAWLGAVAAGLVVLVVVVAVLLGRSPSPGPAQPSHAPSLAPVAADLSGLRQQYRQAAGRRNAATSVWVSQVDSLLQQGADTPSNESGYDSTYAEAIQAFDNALLTMPFPGAMSSDVHGLTNADAALIGALRSAGQGLTTSQFTGDEARAQSAINNLQNDLGLAPSTPFVQPT